MTTATLALMAMVTAGKVSDPPIPPGTGTFCIGDTLRASRDRVATEQADDDCLQTVSVVIVDARVPATGPVSEKVLPEQRVVAFHGVRAPVGQLGCNISAPYTLEKLLPLVACATLESTKPDELETRIIAARALGTIAQTLAKQSSFRVVAERDDAVLTVVLQNATAMVTDEPCHYLVRGQQRSLSYAEQARESRIETDIKTLMRLVWQLVPLEVAARIHGTSTAGCKPEPPDPATVRETTVSWATAQVYRLKLHRATLDVVATVPKSGSETALGRGLATPTLSEAFVKSYREHKETPDCSAAELTNAGRLACLLADKAYEQPMAMRVAAAQGLAAIGGAVAQRALQNGLTACRKVIPSEAADPACPVVSNLGGVAAWDIRTASAAALGKVVVTPPADVPGDPLKAVLLTGPREHWYLSADIALTRMSVDDTGGAEPVDTPTAFHIGVNFLLGDLQTTHQPFWRNIVLKALINASSRPQDSLGFAIGVRGHYGRRAGLDLNLVSPFVGVTWRKRDEATEGTSGRDAELRFGVSLNLDKALGWVK